MNKCPPAHQLRTKTAGIGNDPCMISFEGLIMYARYMTNASAAAVYTVAMQSNTILNFLRRSLLIPRIIACIWRSVRSDQQRQ